MSNVEISAELQLIIDRQVAEGYAASAIDYLEAAVRLYARELEAGDTALAEAAERGLTALRDGDFITIDGSESQRAFWEGVSKDASFRVAAVRATAGDAERNQTPDGSEAV